MTSMVEVLDLRGLAAEERPVVRATRDDLVVLGATRWASPPPGLSRNSVYLLQLGLLVAALLIMFGARMVG